MTRARPIPAALAGLLAMLLLVQLSTYAHGQSPLGIGTAEPSAAPVGPLAGFLTWVNAHQQAFYRALTGALKTMRDGDGDGAGAWPLVGLSFAYGVFHAAGPGHGKAVISSYMIANEVQLRRGVALAALASLAQALTAIVLMTCVFLVLRDTAIGMTDATTFLQNASFALVAAFGAWLLWQKMRPLLRAAPASPQLANTELASAQLAGATTGAHAHAGHYIHLHDEGHHHHHHGAGETCATCGHAHAPDPATLDAARLDWRMAASAVAAVGLRPCSGALIVLTFAFLNGLWVGGIASVLAMATGTAITVALLAILAVTAKGLAMRVAGGGRFGNAVHATIEIGGAALVLVLGLTLLAASLSA